MTQVNSAIRRLLGSAMVCVVLVVGMNGAQAQTAAECIEPQVQSLMNACAAKDFAAADAALNGAWKPAKSFADAIGKGAALLSAQRAWLKYRDAACDVHASPYEGGEPAAIDLFDLHERVDHPAHADVVGVQRLLIFDWPRSCQWRSPKQSLS